MKRRDTSGGLVLGCRDGFIRRYEASGSATDDLETQIPDAFVIYGPIPLGGDGQHEGIVTELFAVLQRGSVLWEVYVADTAREVVDNATTLPRTPFASGTWARSDVLSYKSRPRCRGAFFCLRLDPAGNKAWAIETIEMMVKRVGKLRK